MHGSPRASASGFTMSPLSLIDGPMTAKTPVAASSTNTCSTPWADPAGRPGACLGTSSTGRSSRPLAATSSMPILTASSNPAPPSA